MKKEKVPMFAYPYLANGFGGYHGHKHTNTKKAFLHAVEAGFHFFKADMKLTADDRLVCSIGWDEKACKSLGIEYSEELDSMTYEKFMQWNLFGQESVDAKMLAELMRRFADTYVLIDLKTVPVETAEKMIQLLLADFSMDAALFDRLLLQVNSEEIYEAAMRVYAFPYVQLNISNFADDTELETQLQYAAEHGFCAVSMKKGKINQNVAELVKKAGLCLLAYSLDSRVEAQKYLEMGVDTVCTNYIDLFLGQKASPKEDLHALYHAFHKLPIEPKKVLFSNFHGKGFGCNPKYIALELLERNQKDNLGLDIVWMNDGKDEFPEGIRTVPFNSEQAIREIATSRILVDNQMKFTGFLKRKDQFFVETWHGAIPLKKLGMDNCANIINNKYIERMTNNFDAVDLLLSNSAFCTHMFRRGYAYGGYVLESGCPRNDILTADLSAYKGMVCEKLGIDPTKKLLLYAPTFRSDKSLKAYQLDYHKVAEALGEEWAVLIRLHPHIQKLAKNLVYDDRVVNASNVPDMQELMAGSDMLITDYSNIMFEFMSSGRPCFIYATDIEEYRKERDYYFELTELPFSIAETTEQLIDNIRQFDETKYREDVEKFATEVGLRETGHAARDVVDIMVQVLTDPDYDLSMSQAHLKWQDEVPFYERQRELLRRIYSLTKKKQVLYWKQRQYKEKSGEGMRAKLFGGK